MTAIVNANFYRVVAFVAFSYCGLAWGQFDQLLRQVPASTNAVVLLDAERLFGSALAQREGWAKKFEQAFAAGLVTMSPDTKQLLLAAQMNFEFMRPEWELAIADFGRPRSAVDLARTTKGIFERLADTPAILLRDNAYAIELSPQRFAAMAPANRQSVARWLKDAKSSTAPQVASYLKATLAAAEKSPIVVAFDLEDAVPPDIIRAKLAESDAIKAQRVDVAAAAKALEGIRGLVLEVAVTDGSFGRLMVHFRDDCSALAPAAQPLLQEVLGGLGAWIDDIDGWKVEVQPQRIALNGPLSPAGCKRVLTLLDSPLSNLLDAESAEATAADQQQTKTVAASQQYFKSIESILKDAREESKGAKTFGQSAMWFDKWARRIDKLPLLNVDKDLLGFGQYVSVQLRNMAAALRGIGIGSAAREAQVYQTVTTDYGAYAGYWGGGYSYYTEWRNVDDERRAIRAQEKAAGATSARGIAAELQNALAKVRQDLTQKYQVEF